MLAPIKVLHDSHNKKRYSNCNLLHSNVNEDLFHYLTGIIEGDGTIYVPKTERSAKGSISYPSVQIVFHLKDLPLALLIQEKLGHGSIGKKKDANAYIYTINNLQGIFLLINILNGKMKTNKIYALNRLIDWYNKYQNTSFDKRELNTEPIKSNAWLSGFIEADGHFSIRATEVGKYPRVECKFELSQAQKDNKGKDSLYFLEQIATALDSPVKSTRSSSSYPQYRVRTTNLKGNLAVVNYLEKYPLFGTKFLDYRDWKNLVEQFNQGSFNHKSSIEHAKQIKSCMNDKRTVYNWDHIQNFYSLNK